MRNKKLVVANWKLNLPPLYHWRSLRAPKRVEAVVCPPFPYLTETKKNLNRTIKLGAQDVFWEEVGAYTGEVAPIMLRNFGAEYVIIGHSERRRWLNESDEMINKKILAVNHAGLKPILCVGESISTRRKGLSAAKNFVVSQLREDLKGFSGSGLVVAYEPVWAIGTGRSCGPKDALEVIRSIRKTVSGFRAPNARVIYGGSVDGKNASSFLQYDEIDGLLVGGASLKVKEFAKILKSNH